MRAIILGGVAPHIELIKNLKKRGYETILLDYYENPPAREYADRFYRISTLDYEAVKAAAEKEKADLIITICVDHANVIMCRAAEELGLPAPYSYRTALMTTNKGLMKQQMMASGIPTGNFCVLNSPGDPVTGLGFPVVVKPVDNNGSKGVRKAETEEELSEHIKNAFQFSRTGQVIVEEFYEGKEIQVDCFANEGRANVLMIREKLKIPRASGLAMQTYGSILPAILPAGLTKKIQVIAQSIVEGFGLEHTPFFFQAIADNTDIKVLELTPRIGGGLSYKMLRDHVGFDVVDAAVDSYFGNLPEIDFSVKDTYMITRILYGTDGVFAEVKGVEKMKEEKVITSFDFMAEKGKRLPPIIDNWVDSRNRIGAYIIEGLDYEDVVKKAETAFREIDAVDPEGQSILWRIF